VKSSPPRYIVWKHGAWYGHWRWVDPDGTTHWPSPRSPYATKRDERKAAQWAVDERKRWIAAHLEDLRAAGPGHATLGQVLDAYAADAVERGTRWERGESHRGRIILATLGRETPALALTPLAFTAWRSQLRTRRGPDRPLSNRSLNAYLVILRAALNHAVAQGILPANPIAGVQPLPEAVRTPPALSHHQVAALLAALGPWRARTTQTRVKPESLPRVPLDTRVLLGYYTAGRPEAIDALRWGELDLGRRVLRYDAKLHHAIVVPLEPELVDHLRRLRERRRPRPADLVMPSPDTGRTVNNWRHQWRRLIAAANRQLRKGEQIPADAPIHWLRHSRITHLLLAGVPAQVVAQTTGTSLAMLQRHYAHVLIRPVADEFARARRHRALRLVGEAARGSTRGSKVAPQTTPKRDTVANSDSDIN